MSEFSIVLASGSPRRRELLRNLGLDFVVLPAGADVEPSMHDYSSLEQAARSVEASARAKAVAVARGLAKTAGPHLVIGADTAVRFNRHMLGKPHSEAEARDMLRRLSGRWHCVLSGVCICREGGGECRCAHAVTRVRFRPIGEEEIGAYVATGLPLDKAGAYGIQDMASLFVEKIDGCYFNVMGLPLSVLDRLLKEFGFSILSAAKQCRQ
ncbi:septum formation protein Maf [bacterium]|nr:septum formation protein Maf [bacterium]